MKSLAYGIVLAFLLNACATHNSSTGNLNMPAPSSKSKIVGTAIGTAKARYILGFGGLKSNGLLFEAKRDLQQNYALAPSQIYTNTTIDVKRSFYLVCWTTKLTLTADIFDYEPERNKTWVDSIAQAKSKKTTILSDGISKVSKGDSVFCTFKKNTLKAQVINIDKNDMMTLTLWYDGKYESTTVFSNAIMPIYPSLGCDAKSPYKIGAKFWFGSNNSDQVASRIGTIKNVVGTLYLIEVKEQDKKYFELVTERFLEKENVESK